MHDKLIYGGDFLLKYIYEKYQVLILHDNVKKVRFALMPGFATLAELICDQAFFFPSLFHLKKRLIKSYCRIDC